MTIRGKGSMRYAPEVVNLHTHSKFCGHASGMPVAYVQEAAKAGLQLLGLSDHCPMPDDALIRSRMGWSEVTEYDQACRSAIAAAPESLRVLRAFECDYFPQYHSLYQDYFLGELECDYLLFGVHYLATERNPWLPIHHVQLTKSDLHAYTDQYVASMRSGLFLFGAHPDLFAFNYRTWDDEAKACSRQILSCAVDLHIPLEINGYGFRKPKIDTPAGKRMAYPLREFWELAAEYPLMVTTNSDAHTPKEVAVHLEATRAFATELGLAFCDVLVEDRGSTSHVAFAPHGVGERS